MRQYANIPIGWLSSLMMVILKVELDFGKTFILHGFYIRLRLLSFSIGRWTISSERRIISLLVFVRF